MTDILIIIGYIMVVLSWFKILDLEHKLDDISSDLLRTRNTIEDLSNYIRGEE